MPLNVLVVDDSVFFQRVLTLRMPHFSRVLPSEQEDKIELVRESLTSHFANKQLQHNDVYWRNIGTYKKNGKECAVIFDMASVVSVEGGETDWMEKACVKLSHSNVEEDEGEQIESEEYIYLDSRLHFVQQYRSTSSRMTTK